MRTYVQLKCATAHYTVMQHHVPASVSIVVVVVVVVCSMNKIRNWYWQTAQRISKLRVECQSIESTSSRRSRNRKQTNFIVQESKLRFLFLHIGQESTIYAANVDGLEATRIECGMRRVTAMAWQMVIGRSLFIWQWTNRSVHGTYSFRYAWARASKIVNIFH